MLELKEGKDIILDNRINKEVKVHNLLHELNIEYQYLDHDAAMTMEVCQDIEESLNALICKNLFLSNRQKTNFYLLMLPGYKKFKTKDLSKQLGVARLSFGDEEHMLEYLDITPGSVSVMGLMNDTNNNTQLLIDRDVLKQEYVGCHPCINTSSLRIKTYDLINTILPAIKHNYIVVDL